MFILVLPRRGNGIFPTFHVFTLYWEACRGVSWRVGSLYLAAEVCQNSCYKSMLGSLTITCIQAYVNLEWLRLEIEPLRIGIQNRSQKFLTYSFQF